MDKFDELIKDSIDWVQASKKKKINFDNLLSGIYTEPTHFIYEILQNAEDAKASIITFYLREDELEIFHNGIDFTFEDVEAITGIGNSPKKDDVNSIGKYGVGFKSVLSITETPIIHSGSFHFLIRDIVVPEKIDDNHFNEKTTFQLPFEHRYREKEEIFEMVSNRLQDLGIKTLLFLHNIKEIKWETPTNKGHFLIDFETVNEFVTKRTIISETATQQFLVFKNGFEYDDKCLNIEIAFLLDSESGKIIPELFKDTNLFVYFPTEKYTNLKFTIQAPFKTTTDRAKIDLNDKENQQILKEIGSLLIKSLHYLKEKPDYKTSFYEILPFESSYIDNQVYNYLKKIIDLAFTNEKLLITHDNSFTSAKNAVITKEEESKNFFKNEDLKKLLNRSHWLIAEINEVNNPNLMKYLINSFRVPILKFTDLVWKANSDFFKAKTDDWLIEFYHTANKLELWSDYKLKNSQIIRLENDEHEKPFSSDKPMVFFSNESFSGYKTIKKVFLDDPISVEFFKKLGIKEPDILAEVREKILPKYISKNLNITDEEYNNDIRKIVETFSKTENATQLNELRNYCFLKAKRKDSSDSFLIKPDDIFFGDSDEFDFFKNNSESIFFLDKSYYDENTINFLKSKLKNHFRNIPKIIRFNNNFAYSFLIQLRNYKTATYEEIPVDFRIEGLQFAIENITKRKSIIIWNYLSNVPEHYFQLSYKWTYRRREDKVQFDSSFLKLLKESEWLYDTTDIPKRPNQITHEDLSKEYNLQYSAYNPLMKFLDFKTDDIKKIEEKTGGIFITKEEAKDYEEFKKQKELKKAKEIAIKEPATWKPTTNVSDAKQANFKRKEYRENTRTYERNIQVHNRTEKTEVISLKIQEERNKEKEKVDTKAIGRWGEECKSSKFFAQNL